MQPIRAVVVDDEKTAREGLKSLLAEDSEIELMKCCKDGMEAIEYLQNNPCDLLFLDIQMPAIDGFEVLKSIKTAPATIFITAFDEFAVKAFEHHALDYLLKPFTNSRFFEAVDRAKGLIRSQKVESSRLNQLLEYLQQGEQSNELINTNPADKSRMVIRSSGKIILLNTADIRWVEAYDYYVKIHCDDQTYMIRQSLKGIQERLPPDTFLRVHKSAIVNTVKIKSLEHLQNAEYMMNLDNGTQVKVSRSYKTQVDAFLGLL